MTKLITFFIVLVVAFCAWQGYKYWDETQGGKPVTVETPTVNPDSLAGLPVELRNSYQSARNSGTAVMRTWLKTYDHLLSDPRKAWIQLDFCRDIFRENPAEARAVFAEVKARTPELSPVWPRIKQMEASFE